MYLMSCPQDQQEVSASGCGGKLWYSIALAFWGYVCCVKIMEDSSICACGNSYGIAVKCMGVRVVKQSEVNH